MLPSHLYEALPYFYLVFAITVIAASGMDGFVLTCAALLIGASTLILRMRRDYRRSMRDAGARRARTG